jgi:hypothetical protein
MLRRRFGPAVDVEASRKWPVSAWRPAMKYFVEFGQVTTAGGGLSKLNAKEAMILAKEFHRLRLQNVRIFNAKSFREVSLAELEQTVKRKMPAPLGLRERGELPSA